MKRTLLLLYVGLLATTIVSQDIIPVKDYFKSGFVFSEGYWVYEDTVTHEQDSITLLSCVQNYISPNPVNPDYEEYYLMDFYSHTYDYYFNEFIVTRYWKRNGGGQYGELGQPVMHIGQYDYSPEPGNGFNGYEILDILQNLEVNEHVFNYVVWSRIYKDQQYQYEFDYDTDLYFAPGTGIIRKEYTDSLGINHIWDLVNWQTSIYTGIEEGPTLDQKVRIFPNPAHDKFTIQYPDIFKVELLNLFGKTMLRYQGSVNHLEVELQGIDPGIYFVRILTNKGIITEKLVVD